MSSTYRVALLPKVLLGVVCAAAPVTLAVAQPMDERIMNIGYWNEMAQLGLAPTTTASPSPAPVFSGSTIGSQSVIPQDSPDVPIINTASSTQSENSVFIDPLDPDIVLNSNNSSNNPLTSFFGADYFVSTDGGATWQGSVQGAGGPNRGDPAAAINRDDERFLVGYIAGGSAPNNGGQGVAYSVDLGSSFTHVQVAPNPGSLADKNHLWVDNSPDTVSLHHGSLYSAWTDFIAVGHPDDGRIAFSRSTNGGLTWSAPVSISGGVGALGWNQGVNLQTAPNGHIYSVWAIYDTPFPPLTPEAALGFNRSTNGGASWDTARRIIPNIRGIRSLVAGGGLGGGKTMRTASFPSMTVDPSGNIYVVWANYGVPGANNGDPDIYMIKSANCNTAVSLADCTWSTPTRVN